MDTIIFMRWPPRAHCPSGLPYSLSTTSKEDINYLSAVGRWKILIFLTGA